MTALAITLIVWGLGILLSAWIAYRSHWDVSGIGWLEICAMVFWPVTLAFLTAAQVYSLWRKRR